MSDMSANSWDIYFKSQLGSNHFLTWSWPPLSFKLLYCCGITVATSRPACPFPPCPLSSHPQHSSQCGLSQRTRIMIAWNLQKTNPSKSIRVFILGLHMPCPCSPRHPVLRLQGCLVLPQPSLESFCRTEVLGIPQIWRVYFVLGAPKMAFLLPRMTSLWIPIQSPSSPPFTSLSPPRWGILGPLDSYEAGSLTSLSWYGFTS